MRMRQHNTENRLPHLLSSRCQDASRTHRRVDQRQPVVFSYEIAIDETKATNLQTMLGNPLDRHTGSSSNDSETIRAALPRSLIDGNPYVFQRDAPRTI